MDKELFDSRMATIKTAITEAIKKANAASAKLAESLTAALEGDKSMDQTLWLIGRAMSDYQDEAKTVTRDDTFNVIGWTREMIREG